MTSEGLIMIETTLEAYDKVNKCCFYIGEGYDVGEVKKNHAFSCPESG
jgi:hypothetical protein